MRTDLLLFAGGDTTAGGFDIGDAGGMAGLGRGQLIVKEGKKERKAKKERRDKKTKEIKE